MPLLRRFVTLALLGLGSLLPMPAAATPSINSAVILERVFNDCPSSVLTVTNAYPESLVFVDAQLDCFAFSNLHSWSLSSNGSTAAVFENGDAFRVAADLVISGTANGEAGLRVSPWWSPDVDGRFNCKLPDGEIACFGGRLPFYSFTTSHGLQYVRNTLIHLEVIYLPNDLSAANPATIEYKLTYNNTQYSSGPLAFDQGNPAEDPPHGLWGMLSPAYVGGFFQPHLEGGNPAAQARVSFTNVVFENLDGPPLPPGSVVATPQCGAVSIAWDPVPNAAGYRVRRGGVVISGVDPIAASPFVDTNPGPGTHCYDVCTIAIDGDSACSAAACAQQAVAPTVSLGSKDATIPQGAKTGFSVFATGTNLTFTWRRNGVAVPGAPNERYLHLANVQPGDAGSYDCEVCNSCGCVTSAAMVLQVCPSVSATGPRRLRAMVGDASVSIAASITGSPSSIQWILRGVALWDGPKYSGTNTATLTILDPTVTDAGEYQIKLAGACGNQWIGNVCYLEVGGCTTVATIVTHPSSQDVSLGGPATFTVGVSACDSPTYQWQQAGAREWITLPGATLSAYSIPSVGAADVGTYRCVVGTPNGPSAFSNPANLNLASPTILTSGAKSTGCTSAYVYWQTSVPTTAVVRYGSDCRTLTQTTPAAPLGLSGSTTIDLPGVPYAAFQVIATAPGGASVSSACQTAYFQSAPGNLHVQAWGQPFYGEPSAPTDSIPVRIRLQNTGCAAIQGPITLVSMGLNGAPPRRSDGSIDLPRDLTVPALEPGEIRDVDGLVFSRTEVGAPPRSTVMGSGVIRYGSPPREVSVKMKVSLP